MKILKFFTYVLSLLTLWCSGVVTFIYEDTHEGLPMSSVLSSISLTNQLQLMQDAIEQMEMRFYNVEHTVLEHYQTIQNQLRVANSANCKIRKEIGILNESIKNGKACGQGRGQLTSPSTSVKNLPKSCLNFKPERCPNSICKIQYPDRKNEALSVSCDNIVSGGGWIVMQRRFDGSVDFLRNWTDYKNGFGKLDGEYWLGLDKLHAFTSSLGPLELLIELVDFDNVTKYAKYDSFIVGSEEQNYTIIDTGKYSGTAGDSLSQHIGKQFSTVDRDNDSYEGNCAEIFNSPWWMDECSWSSLNGLYYKDPKQITNNDGLNWFSFHGYEYSLKATRMLIRPKEN